MTVRKEKARCANNGPRQSQTANNSNTNRFLPHNDEAEIELLNGIFAGADAGDLAPVEKARRIIGPADFYRRGGGLIFGRILEFHEAGRAFNMSLIENSFEGDPAHDGISHLFDQLLPITGQTVVHFSKIVLELSIRRTLIAAAGKALEDFFSLEISTSKVLDELDAALMVARARLAV